jgi:hypothetical protein
VVVLYNQLTFPYIFCNLEYETQFYLSSCPGIEDLIDRKQTTIALSTTEAEYVALSEAAHEVMCMVDLVAQVYEQVGSKSKGC